MSKNGTWVFFRMRLLSPFVYAFSCWFCGGRVSLVFLVGGLFVAAYLLEVHLLKTGRLTKENETNVGCGFTFIIWAILFGMFSLEYALYDTDNWGIGFFEIGSFVFLIMGIGIILFNLFKRGK